MHTISLVDRTRIAAAIAEAERHTAGEIVCVLMRSSSDYSYGPILWASFLALLSPWAFMFFTHVSTVKILSAQIAVFIATALILWWPPLRMLLVPRSLLRTRAHRAAMEQFFARGVSLTKDRMGVMIFVSLAERYARIIADNGAARLIDHEDWQHAVDALTAQMPDGHIAEGFIAAIERCGKVLAEHVPPNGEPHVLPNRIYVL
ncbi:MAG: hypothetical protein KGL46_02200 [Hyphomicrobiales bacterium]|nr:hypothetical protein [Hyphomicrobiales bacterium]